MPSQGVLGQGPLEQGHRKANARTGSALEQGQGLPSLHKPSFASFQLVGNGQNKALEQGTLEGGLPKQGALEQGLGSGSFQMATWLEKQKRLPRQGTHAGMAQQHISFKQHTLLKWTLGF